MTIEWKYRAALENAYSRKARLVVETFDPVTLEPVWDGVRLSVENLDAKPRVSSGGRFVWFEERGRSFDKLKIDLGRLPYTAPEEVAIPPLPAPPPPPLEPVTHVFMRLELGLSPAYLFDAGITGLRARLIRNVADQPPQSLVGAEVRLRWIDDNAPGETWRDAPTISHTTQKGDFAAVVRLASNQIARADAAHRMRVRVAVTHAGNTRFSQELQIPFDKVTDAQQSLAWDDLLP